MGYKMIKHSPHETQASCLVGHLFADDWHAVQTKLHNSQHYYTTAKAKGLPHVGALASEAEDSSEEVLLNQVIMQTAMPDVLLWNTHLVHFCMCSLHFTVHLLHLVLLLSKLSAHFCYQLITFLHAADRA